MAGRQSGSSYNHGAFVNTLEAINIDGDKDTVVDFEEQVDATDINIYKGAVKFGDFINPISKAASNGLNFMDPDGGGKIVFKKLTDRTTNPIPNINIIGAKVAGTVELEKTLGRSSLYFGKIGDIATGHMLHEFNIDNDSTGTANTAVFREDVNIQRLGGNGGNLRLLPASAPLQVRIEEVVLDHVNSETINQFGMRLGGDAILMDPGKPVYYGTADNKMRTLVVEGDDNTLTLQDNVHLFAREVYTDEKGDTRGHIILEGNNEFSAPMNNLEWNSGDGFVSLSATGAGKTAKLYGKHRFNNDVTVSADTTLVLDNSLLAANIKGAADGAGTMVFNNDKDSIITAAMPAGSALAKMEFANADLQFTGAINSGVGVNVMEHTGANDITVDFTNAGAVLGGSDYINSTATVFKVMLPANTTTFTENLAGGPGTLNIELKDGSTAVLDGAVSLDDYVVVTTSESQRGTLILNTATPMKLNYAGTPIKRLAEVQFSTDSEIANTHADRVKIDAGVAATFTKVVDTEESIEFGGAGATALFRDGVDVDSAITTAVAGTGNVDARDATFRKDITDINSAAFYGNNPIYSRNITANEVTFKSSKANFHSNINIRGENVYIAGSEITLNDKHMDITEKSKLSVYADNTFKFDVNLDEGVLYGGRIAVGADGMLDIQSSNITLMPRFTGATAPAPGTRYDFILNEGAITTAFDPSMASVVEVGTGVGWAPVKGKNGGVALEIPSIPVTHIVTVPDEPVGGHKSPQALPVPEERWKPEGEEGEKGEKGDTGIKGYQGPQGVDGPIGPQGPVGPVGPDGPQGPQGVDGPVGPDGPQGSVGNQGPVGPQGSAGASLPAGSTSTGSGTGGTGGAGGSGGGSSPASTAATIAANLANVKDSSTELTDAETVRGVNLTGANIFGPVIINIGQVSGTSAGEDETKYGAWFNPFFRVTEQKKSTMHNPYKSELYGFNAGLDFKVNDDLITGGAIAFMQNSIKHKGVKAGDGAKITSYLMSMYTLRELTDKIFIDGIVTVGMHNVKNNDLRQGENAHGAYDVTSVGSEFLLGAKVKKHGYAIVPTVGIRYNRVGAISYTETNAIDNRTVRTKADQSLDLMAGLRIGGKQFEVAQLKVSPEIHGTLSYDVLAKTPTQRIESQTGKTITPIKRKVEMFEYSVGIDFNTEIKSVEVGVGYDYRWAKKRSGHEGTLSVRVNF